MQYIHTGLKNVQYKKSLLSGAVDSFYIHNFDEVYRQTIHFILII